jgi:hypothetical protein
MMVGARRFGWKISESRVPNCIQMHCSVLPALTVQEMSGYKLPAQYSKQDSFFATL